MKKMILAVALLLTGIVSAQADGREKPITIDNLPKAAQEFLATYFKDLTVAYAVEESKYFGSEYEVTYTDRTEVEFRADGQWSAVDRKYSAVREKGGYGSRVSLLYSLYSLQSHGI